MMLHVVVLPIAPNAMYMHAIFPKRLCNRFLSFYDNDSLVH